MLAVYLHTERAVNHPTTPAHFYDWMKARPELYTIIRRLLRRIPMGVLGYANIKPFNKMNIGDGHPSSEMGIVVVSRTRELLGSQTVLKSDHCPGCQQLYLPERVYEAWEHVSIDAVQNPLEVFKPVEADGFPIKYACVPTTDGKAPKSLDFDKLAINISSAPKDTAFVFNCHTGRGRTTTGTVIACLLKLQINHGRPIRVLLDDVACGAELDSGSSSGDEGGVDPVSKGRTRVDASHAFDVPEATQEDLFGHDARPRPDGKPRPAKKTKSDVTASTGGSSASTQFGELMEQELRLKREVAERAFEVQAEKDRTLIRLEELRFLATRHFCDISV
nr:paladin isoform X2 [Tanacetum cinerariifolium]